MIAFIFNNNIEEATFERAKKGPIISGFLGKKNRAKFWLKIGVGFGVGFWSVFCQILTFRPSESIDFAAFLFFGKVS